MKINTPKQNNRYRGPIESVKIENFVLILSYAIDALEERKNKIKQNVSLMKSHNKLLYSKIYEGMMNE